MYTKQIFISFLALLLAACSQPAPQPTAVATAELDTAPTLAPSIEQPTAEPTATLPAPIEPTAVPAAEPTALPETAVAFSGTSFTYAPGLANAISPSVEPASNADLGAPYWAYYPAYQRFDFEEYPHPDPFHEPRIEVYPAKAYASLNAIAKERIEQLQTMLAERPLVPPAELPFIPFFNAAQVIHTNISYLTFNGGQGLRFITYYAQAPYPITNHDIFYTFQGITDDGESYIAAIFPVSTAALPDTIDTNTFNFDAFIDDFDSYMAETTAALESQADSDYAPSLADLDATVQSFRLTPATAIPAEQLTIAYPLANGQATVGSDLEVSGQVPPAGDSSVTVRLLAGNNTLAEAQAAVDTATGAWATTLTIPLSVIGQGRVEAATASQTAVAPVYLLENFSQQPGPADVVMRLSRPFSGETAVAGYPIYFEGDVQKPIDNTVTIGLLIDNCSRFAAQQSFTVGGGGAWNGMVILPEGIEGETACAVAYTGTYGQGNWREVQIPFPVYAATDPLATRIAVANFTSLAFRAGGFAQLSGTAVNANEVLITIKNGDGSVLVEGTTPVGDFGFWDASLLIPEDASDFVQIDIAIVDATTNEPYLYQIGATITR